MTATIDSRSWTGRRLSEGGAISGSTVTTRLLVNWPLAPAVASKNSNTQPDIRIMNLMIIVMIIGRIAERFHRHDSL